MLGIIALIFVIVTPFLVYRNAKQNGHNTLIWTLSTLAVGLGIQIGIPVLFAITYGVILISMGHSEEELQSTIQVPATVIGLICVVISVIGALLIMKRVSKIAEDKPMAAPPPAPPTFS